MPDVAEMTGQDLNRLNDLNRRRMPYARHRTSGWKARIRGEWLHGFVSEEQALAAVYGPFELP